MTLDPNPCRIGWGPCPSVATGGHVCERGADHVEPCRCGMCGVTHRPTADEYDDSEGPCASGQPDPYDREARADELADRAQIAALGAAAEREPLVARS